jgi:hypothetical protein
MKGRYMNAAVTYSIQAFAWGAAVMVGNKSGVMKLNKKNSGALVRQRTIPTERPLLVGEISANFGG